MARESVTGINPQDLALTEFEVFDAKTRGAYYTPESVVRSLVSWAVRDPADRLLDPSCGDGRFLAAHRNCTGIEQDLQAALESRKRAPWAVVHEGDFFSWAENTNERFECTAGNPPFIRYQSFRGGVRERALSYCTEHGAHFTGLTSSWAPFLVAAATLLKPDGRMAFVIPAEIGHSPYAAPLIEFLVSKFSQVHVVAIKEKIFPELSQDCWLLNASGFGGSTDHIFFSTLQLFQFMSSPPTEGIVVPVTEWRSSWKSRLRPFLIPAEARSYYQRALRHPLSKRLGDIASVGIGYVTGANEFFHLKPSLARKLRINNDLLQASVRNSRMLPAGQLTSENVREWYRSDLPMLLLKLTDCLDLPASVRSYLESSAGREAQKAYKCRNRSPWYVVPDVVVPDFFLTYMSSGKPNLALNAAGCSCTNSLHAVRLKSHSEKIRLHRAWSSALVELSCELEGHPLGGGMLKLEPREATRILITNASLCGTDTELLLGAIEIMRQWRHCA